MPALLSADLINLRTNHPHIKNTFLSVAPKDTLLSAQINDAPITIGAESIIFNNGTGTAFEFGLVGSGQTLLIGTAEGKDDLGRARITGLPTGDEGSGTIPVAWNSDVNWTDGAYITVIHWYELWPLFPRFDISTEKFFKDKDDSYSTQNENMGHIIRMGCGWGGRLGPGGTVVVTLDGSRSYPMDGTATADVLSWTVETKSATASPSIADGTISTTTITFDEAGLYWVRYSILNSNNLLQSSRRFFIVHDNNNPPYKIEQATRTMDFDSNGGELRFTVRGEADESLIPKRAPLILWSDNYYNAVAANVSFQAGDEYTDREHIDFVGYLTDADTDIGADRGQVSFTAHTIHEQLDNKYEYPVSLIADKSITGTVNEWWKYPHNDLTVSRGLYHLWKFHSTLLEVADVVLDTTDTRIRAAITEYTQGSLLDRADTFAYGNSVYDKPACDKYGVLYVGRDAQMLETSALRSALVNTITVTTQDWRGELSADPQERPEFAAAYITGGAWTGLTFNAYCARYGEIAANEGSGYLTQHKLMVSSQAQLNQIGGRILAKANNPIKELGIQFAGNYSSAFDIMPQEWHRVTLTGSEVGNLRGLVLNNARCVPRRIETTFNEPSGLSKTSVFYEVETLGRDLVTVACPGMPEPPFEPPPPIWELGSFNLLLVGTTDQGLWMVPPQGDPFQSNTGLTGDDLLFRAIAVHPAQSVLPIVERHVWSTHHNGISLSIDGGQSWTTHISKATIGVAATQDIVGIGLDPLDDPYDPQKLYLMVGFPFTWPTPIVKFYFSDDYGSTWDSLEYDA